MPTMTNHDPVQESEKVQLKLLLFLCHNRNAPLIEHIEECSI